MGNFAIGPWAAMVSWAEVGIILILNFKLFYDTLAGGVG